MAKKGPEKTSIQSHEFSPLYREKKARIQEANYYEFIEFLNWVENVNNGKKKEDGKRLTDEWFNKYSDAAIVWLFNMFVNLKKTKPQGYTYEDILNEAKSAFKTEIYGENIVRQLFGRYGNYLKYLKRRRIQLEAEKAVKTKHEKADIVKQKEKSELIETLVYEGVKNRYTGDDENIENEDGDVIPNPKYEHIPVENEYVTDELFEINKEEEESQTEEDGQLKIPFGFED